MKNKFLTILKSKIFIYSCVVLLLFIAVKYPYFIEEYYSNFIYFYISNLLRIVFGIFGISIGDILIFILVIYLIFKLYKYLKYTKKSFIKDSKVLIEKLLFVYILFQFFWGLNYHRVPLHEKLDLKREYSQEELLDFTEKLIKHTNKIQRKITKNKDSLVINHTLQDNMYRNTVNDYKNVQEKYSYLYFTNQSSKSSLWSIWLSISGFGGYFNPFTGEIQINNLQPNYDSPTLVCHEMAHQLGYASEAEANFIAILVTIKSDNLLTNYSASTFLLKYCLNNLEQENKDKCIEKINPGILKNFEEDKKHQEKYSTFLEPLMKKIYNNFLLFNSQEDGIEEYNKFLGMLMSLDKNEDLLVRKK